MGKKKRARIAAAVCAAALTLQASSLAASARITDAAVSANGGDMLFSGKTTPGNKVTYLVFPDDDEPQKTYAGIGELWAEADGSFQGDFQLNISGEFILRLKDSDGYVDLAPFLYSRTQDRLDFLVKVHNAKQDTVKETAVQLKAEFTAPENSAALRTLLGDKFEAYKAMTSAMARELEEHFAEFCDFASLTCENAEASFVADFNMAYSLTVVNNLRQAEIDAALGALDFGFENTPWAAVTDSSLRTWVLKYIENTRPYASVDALEEEYLILNALYRINNSGAAGLPTLIKGYADLLGLSASTVVQQYLSSTDDNVKKALATKLTASPAYTPAMLESAVSDALKSGSKPNTNSPNVGGSGRTSGSTASGAGTIGGVTVEQGDPEDIQLAEPKELFSDMYEAEWAREAIETLYARRIVSGDGDGGFRPNAGVTRVEFVKLVVEAFGITAEKEKCNFLDVFEKDWFYPYVSAAWQAGVVTGISENFFGVSTPITRQDAAVLLARIADYRELTLSSVREYQRFTDSDAISDYAADAVRTLYCSGIINGMEDGSFRPQGICTRAEAAKLIYGLI